jgi:hypothetical protein
VRVFPLIGQFGTEYSPHVSEVLSRLDAEGYECEIKQVLYEFQKGGNRNDVGPPHVATCSLYYRLCGELEFHS